MPCCGHFLPLLPTFGSHQFVFCLYSLLFPECSRNWNHMIRGLFGGHSCLRHIKVPRAQVQTYAKAVTKETAVTKLDPKPTEPPVWSLWICFFDLALCTWGLSMLVVCLGSFFLLFFCDWLVFHCIEWYLVISLKALGLSSVFAGYESNSKHLYIGFVWK